MKKILLCTTAILVLLLMANTAIAQKKNTLEGVWKVVEVRISHGKDSIVTDSSPQPSLMIFTKRYYSVLAIRGGNPRAAVEPAKDPQNLTDAEKIARYESWRQFVANSGTYDIKGSTIIRRPIVAKSVDVMTSETPAADEFKLEGNTLWLIVTRDPAIPERRVKWTRIE